MAEIKKGPDKFYVGDDEENPLAEIHFVPNGTDKIILDHTYVAEELRGQGIGERLVKRAAAFARETGVKIIPLCPFARSRMDEQEEYQDVLYK